MRAELSVAAAALALAGAAVAASWAGAAPAGDVCPANITNTKCSANATCCSQMFSGSGYGCCTLGPDAVCCGLQSCCPSGYTCVNKPPYASFCVPPGGGAQQAASIVCAPGPQYPPQPGKRSVIVIGDSVSIGYTPVVTQLLNDSGILVQHSPWSGGGGADDTGNGLNCLEQYLRDSTYTAQPWDLISFNFGLHNLDNSSSAEALYAQQLDSIAARLQQTGSKLVYITTTPYMKDRVFNYTVVEQLNAIAAGIMQRRSIPVADLYHWVTKKCGDVYRNCSICDNEWDPATNVTCGYHYTPAGWDYLGSFVAPVYASMLGQ